MPTRVIPQVGVAAREDISDVTESLQSLHTSPSDRSETASREGRTRKRLQKHQPDGTNSFLRATANAAENPDQHSNANPRRKPSLRNQKAPMGARPLMRSPSKTSSSQEPNRPARSTSFGLKSIPRSRQSSVANPPQPPFNNTLSSGISAKDDENRGAPFLPEVNFDDFHTSITGEPNLYDLAASGTDFASSSYTKNSVGLDNGLRGFTTSSKRDSSETRMASNSLPQRRQSNFPSSRTQTSVRTNTTAVGVNPQPARPRRQSHFPSAASSTNIARAPRKSIGPGILPHSASDYSFLRRDITTSAIQNKAEKEPTSLPSQTVISQQRPRSPASGSEDTSQSFSKLSRGKNTQNTRKNGAEHLRAAPSTPDNPWTGFSGQSSQSPLRHSQIGNTTPSSNKRLSVMPGHATGLGARTISPTDARRLKRLSMMQGVPPIPTTPPTSLPDPSTAELKAALESASQIPRKIDTPLSNRTTPDPNRKSINSTISVSSNASLNSMRAQNAGSTRSLHNLAASRLPTLKGRSDVVSTGSEEGVPPVPAIPKAYESPKNEQDLPFNFVPRKSSLQFDASSSASVSTIEYPSAASSTSSDKETPKAAADRQRRKTLATQRDGVDDRASGAQNGRRTLQPIRLPPLNLLPASEPTADKLAALADPTAKDERDPTTPPPRRGAPKTPSTPMTASKATFFHRRTSHEDTTIPSHLRTSSSHFNLRSDGGHFRIPSSSVIQAANAIDIKPPRKTVSPFTSASLPKSNSEFDVMKLKATTDRQSSNVGAEVRSSRLTGPRAQMMSKVSKTDLAEPSGASTDTEATSFGSTLRRKLSLTRRRSNSKAESEHPPPPPDHEIMPPPKLPASATLTNFSQQPTNTAQRPTYLHSRRKSAAADALIRHDRNTVDTNGLKRNKDQTINGLTEGQNAITSSRTVSSSIPSGPRLYSLNNNRAPAKLQTIDTALDRDDETAEEEMKRLASKKRVTETAARELDELRRRAIPKDGVTPAQALRAARLNLFERGEVVDYKEIYFCGTQSAQKFEGNAEAVSTNFGYDDERGDYNIVLGDHLAYRYEVIDILGKGSFGQVVRCIDHKTGGLVAIKIIRNKKRFHQQALVEVNILQKLREWDPNNKFSMVNFTAHFYFRGHLCISTELLGSNLYEFIKLHDFKGFSLKLIRRFTKQMLNSLVLLQNHKIIHCDMKPENILLAHPSRSEIKVIDFGSSCHENERVYTYIQSRFYRSPEVILGMTYGMPIDMWSLGCILAELLTGYPIFPGENEQEQLACIMEIFGPPDKTLIEKATRKKLFFDSLGKPRLSVSSKGKRRRPSSKTLQQALKCDDEAFLDFLSGCLRWDPERRMKPDEATHHEFVTGVKPTLNRNLRALPHANMRISTSPIKRFNSVHTPSTTIRPLPDPPAIALRNGVNPRLRELNTSPSKSAAKRYSSTTTMTNGVSSARKGSNIAATNTLPKPGGNLGTNGRTDLASAAAAAAAFKTR